MSALTPTEAAVLALIADAAGRGDSCPSNTHLANEAGLWGAADVARVMASMERKGAIAIKKREGRRIIEIVATGKRTAFKPRTALRTQRHPVRNYSLEAIPEAVKRDPCFGCGIPYDRHDAHGCKRWRGEA